MKEWVNISRLRVAVIGCGAVSIVHLEPIVNSRRAELIAVCDLKPDRAKASGEEYGVPWYTDYQDVLKLKPDIIHICTSHASHAEIAIAALTRGIHVLTEKPMSINLHDADRMINAAKTGGLKLGVIFQNRYNPSSQAVYEAVRSGKLGKLLGCRAFVNWYRSAEYYSESDWKGTWDQEGGGVLINQAIHTIDLMQWIMGEIDSLEGTITNRNHPSIEVEDVAEALIRFKNGALGNFYACNNYSCDAPIFLEIHGEKGLAIIEKDTAAIRIQGKEYEVTSEETPTLGKSYWGLSHETQINQFYRAVLNNEQVEICGEAGRKALEVVRAIYYSSVHGSCRVKFPFQEPRGFTPPPFTNN